MEISENASRLQPGERIQNEVFAVSGVKHVTAGDFQFLAFKLYDKSGEYKASLLSYSKKAHEELLGCDFIRINGMVQTKERYRGQIEVHSYSKEERPIDIRPYLQPLPTANATHRIRFEELLSSVQEPNLRALLDKVFDADTRQQFFWAVAAKGMHHAYRGGLLEHTVEVADLCDQACQTLLSFGRAVERDFLVSCALMHDIGKLDEMRHGIKAGEYTDQGVLDGHITLGTLRIAAAIERIPDFPAKLRHAVLHLILSHHGQMEFGSPKEPAMAEAFVLAECDLISARVFECLEVKEKAVVGQSYVWLDSVKRNIYVGDLELSPVPSSPSHLSKPALTLETLAPPAVAFEINTAILLPVRGRVAAGDPGKSSEERDEAKLVIPPSGGADYLLHVVGDSMDSKGILDGDLVYVRELPLSQASYRDGDTVVARVEGEGETVKTLRFRAPAEGQASEAWLTPESANPIHQPRQIDEQVVVHGKVIGLLRDTI